jgi:hypothetical protein
VCKCVPPPGDNPIAVNKYYYYYKLPTCARQIRRTGTPQDNAPWANGKQWTVE